MAQITITGIHVEVDDKLRKYINRKFSALDKYLAKQVVESVKADVRLIESKQKGKKLATCKVTVSLPNDTITVKEATVNLYAAVDIAEEKLRHAYQKYTDKHDRPRLYRRLIGRFQRSNKQ
jgi:ribosomal subunit interface protein